MLIIHFNYSLIDSKYVSLIASKITANVYIDTNKYFFTYEALAIRDNKILLGDLDGM